MSCWSCIGGKSKANVLFLFFSGLVGTYLHLMTTNESGVSDPYLATYFTLIFILEIREGETKICEGLRIIKISVFVQQDWISVRNSDMGFNWKVDENFKEE